MVAATLAEIEDRLANDQDDHAKLNGIVKRKEKFMDTYEATLFEAIPPEDYDNPTERKALAKALLHGSEEYVAYLDELEQLEVARKTLDYLDIRRSICQSILRRGSDPGDDHRHGGEGRTQHHLGS